MKEMVCVVTYPCDEEDAVQIEKAGVGVSQTTGEGKEHRSGLHSANGL